MTPDGEKKLISELENIGGYLDQIVGQLDGIRKALTEKRDD
jgi:hypothetical protein